jgi:hypothetical protein
VAAVAAAERHSDRTQRPEPNRRATALHERGEADRRFRSTVEIPRRDPRRGRRRRIADPTSERGPRAARSRGMLAGSVSGSRASVMPRSNMVIWVPQRPTLADAADQPEGSRARAPRSRRAPHRSLSRPEALFFTATGRDFCNPWARRAVLEDLHLGVSDAAAGTSGPRSRRFCARSPTSSETAARDYDRTTYRPLTKRGVAPGVVVLR